MCDLTILSRRAASAIGALLRVHSSPSSPSELTRPATSLHSHDCGDESALPPEAVRGLWSSRRVRAALFAPSPFSKPRH